MRWFQRVSASDEQRIVVFMKDLSALQPADGRHVADERLLWLRGQLLRRWDADRRVHAPIDIADRLQLVGSLAAVVALVVWGL